MAISFVNPWLLGLIVPALYLLWHWWKRERRYTKGRKWLVLSIRTLIFLLLILALARMEWMYPVQGKTIVFVVDRSASIADSDIAFQQVEKALQDKKPEDQIAIVTVGEEAVVEQSLSTADTISSFSAVINKHATNLASGLRLASGFISDEMKGKVVLISDGAETVGHARVEADRLRERGIPVDVVSLSSKQGPEVLLTEMKIPSKAYQTEKIPIRVQVKSTTDTKATLRLYEKNRLVEEQKISLVEGENTFSFATSASQSGLVRYHAEIVSDQDTLPQNNQVYGFSQVSGNPRVLIVEGKPGEGQNLADMLMQAGVEVKRSSASSLPDTLEGYQQFETMVLVNTPAYAISTYKMEMIQSAVRDLGMGLIMTGGENSYALGGWFQTPIETLLPVDMELRDKKRMPSLGLMLVIDRSGSMSGQKLDMAKEAAIRSTQLLTPQDQLGVLAFDSKGEWIVSPQPVTKRDELIGQIGGIVADGGTSIYPALTESFQALSQLKVKRKHIILLTDGHSSEGDYTGLAQKMQAEGITLSTIAVGAGADQVLLESIAQVGKGRHYLAESPDQIPTIFSKEATMATRSYVVDEPFIPKWVGAKEWHNQVPPLRAYVATTPKQTAEMVLASSYPDPVLARWQYGLGRTVAWTSDISGKWSPDWVSWNGFPKFWNQVVTWSYPQYQNNGVHVEHQMDGNQMILRVSKENLNQHEIQLQLLDDEGNKESVSAKMVAPGEYEGVFSIDEPGVYFAQVGNPVSLGTYGITVPYSAEYASIENKTHYLEQIATAGGGVHRTDISGVWQWEESKWGKQSLAWYLIFVALLLWPFDIACRKISWPIIRLEKKENGKQMKQVERLHQLKQVRKQPLVEKKEYAKPPTKITPLPSAPPKKIVRQSPQGTHLSSLLAAKRKRDQQEQKE
ncbi:VWA domain-containing protein [Hazenella sp. IB182353]|uniref:VWA domain-containing protein n=1 Tax=Polycladospora coralii TaxID=2771432 RepID=UPI0017471507|nr:VWA domain-containing protein [Polycladospora coralii]